MSHESIVSLGLAHTSGAVCGNGDFEAGHDILSNPVLAVDKSSDFPELMMTPLRSTD